VDLALPMENALTSFFHIHGVRLKTGNRKIQTILITYQFQLIMDSDRFGEILQNGKH
jgi:hypothetical protein